jgi:uncharacterized heparinase superfamily protein
MRTLRHLKASQIAYMVWRRLGPRPSLPPRPDLVTARPGLCPGPFLATQGSLPAPSTFCFLNRNQVFDPEAMDWEVAEMPKLWCYNLHYFDFITDPDCSPELAGRLIESWIAGNPPGAPNAWEPYAVSKRIVNWVKHFIAVSATGEIPQDWCRSLHQQAAWLERDLEYHILANHFFKNAVALFFAGLFFEGKDAARWLDKALKILRKETPEQFLADGGHYERSLLYHAIMLEDLLDLLKLAKGTSGLLPEGDLALLRATANRAVAFLEDLLYPDGEIPLFNDAAFGIAPRPAVLLDYAALVLERPRRAPAVGPEMIMKAESGYFGARSGGDMVLIDCGPMGPDYQPGHGHCDILSYELCLDGRRVVVDSGMHDYDLGELRSYLRSTAAHNTLRIDDAEQSEIWHAFRVGRRARPLKAQMAPDGDHAYLFQGGHDGYERLPGIVLHHREIRFGKDGRLDVSDRVSGLGRHKIESYLHIHPDFEVKRRGTREVQLSRDGVPVAMVTLGPTGELYLEEGLYCSEFGICRDSAQLRVITTSDLPVTITYSIEKA